MKKCRFKIKNETEKEFELDNNFDYKITTVIFEDKFIAVAELKTGLQVAQFEKQNLEYCLIEVKTET